MASLRKRRIGKQTYYYLEVSYKVGGKTKLISNYLGKKIPSNLEKLKEKMENKILIKRHTEDLKKIKKGYAKELKKQPKLAREKNIESFMVRFTYNSNKIEGSKLSLRDTANLLKEGITPRDKPLKDVKECEGHKSAFYKMLNYKGQLCLREVCTWHRMIFENSNKVIAGKIRKHKIQVTGSRVVFPWPEKVDKLLKDFFKWHYINKNKINPVELAAITQLKFLTIHPFTDGNGRIGRLITNYILNKNDYPMINIKYSDRRGYYNALEQSQLNEKCNIFTRFFIKKYIKENEECLK